MKLSHVEAGQNIQGSPALCSGLKVGKRAGRRQEEDVKDMEKGPQVHTGFQPIIKWFAQRPYVEQGPLWTRCHSSIHWLPFWSTSHFSLAVEEIQSLAPFTYQGRKPLHGAHKGHSQQLLRFPNSKVRVASHDTQENGCKDKEKLWKRLS